MTDITPLTPDAQIDEILNIYKNSTQGNQASELAKAQLLALIETARVEAINGFVSEFQTVAIAETDDYANGWNDCRQRVRKDLNRLAESYSTTSLLKALKENHHE